VSVKQYFIAKLTRHMVASVILLDPHSTIFSWAPLRHLLDLLDTRIVLALMPMTLAPVILLTGLAHVKRLVVCSAHKEVTSIAAENVAFRATVVDLAGLASWTKTVAKVGYVAEDASSGKFVISLIADVSTTKWRRWECTYRS
jgi:hypothetical protein